MKRFHTVSAIAPSMEYERKDWLIDADTDRYAKLYDKYLPKRGMMALPFDDLDMEVRVINSTTEGAALLHVEIADIIGLGMLVMGGYNQRADNVYACRFTKKCASRTWRLPLPPMEIEDRPLFYYAVFRLSEAVVGQQWYAYADRVVRKANSLGVALLRSSKLSTQQEENEYAADEE